MKAVGLARLAMCLVLLGVAAAAIAAPATATVFRPSRAVFTETNRVANKVVVWVHDARGRLHRIGSLTTGGLGSGHDLGSQGAVALGGRGRWLFAVNAGSDQVSVFRLRLHEVRLVHQVVTGGTHPVSLAVHGDLVYVLNTGGAGGITGFRMENGGRLAPIAGSAQPLSNGGAGPSPDAAQIGFSADGAQLVVTEKDTGMIDLYAVDAGGVAGPPVTQPSAGATPFGFAVTPGGLLLVSEAREGAAGQASVSSYTLGRGLLTAVSPSAPDTQTAACGLALTPDAGGALTTNGGSGTVSRYRVGADGHLTLWRPVAASTGARSHPADIAVTAGGAFVYVVASGNGQIIAFKAGSGGKLTRIDTAGRLPHSVAGLAVR